jgi:ABC-type glycerol-3-phosphate transport system permease component
LRDDRHRSGRKTLAQRAKSGDLEVKRQATWGMSVYTLQVGLNTYAGELNVQWHFILAMTVVTMIPVVLVFIFLQRYITAGIAGTGLK